MSSGASKSRKRAAIHHSGAMVVLSSQGSGYASRAVNKAHGFVKLTLIEPEPRAAATATFADGREDDCRFVLPLTETLPRRESSRPFKLDQANIVTVIKEMKNASYTNLSGGLH